METVFSVILYFLITALVGINIIMISDRSGALGLIETAALSYLFGIAVISIEMFVMGASRVKFTALHILLPWIILSVFNIVPFYRRFIGRPRPTKPPRARSDLTEKFITALLVIAVLYTFFVALSKPIEDYDSVAIWAYKAKALYLVSPADFLNVIKARFTDVHPDYPFLFPLSQAWLYVLMNNFDDYAVKAIFPASYLAFLLIFYSWFNKASANRKLSLALTFILASTSHFSFYATNGYADSQIAIYYSIAFISFYMWVKRKISVYLFIAVFSAIAAFWTKNEGSPMLMIMLGLLILFIIKNYRSSGFGHPVFKNILLSIIILSLSFVLWEFFKRSVGFRNDIINSATLRHLNPVTALTRLAPISYEYQKIVFGIKYWNIAWIVFIFAAIRNFKHTFSDRYVYITVPLFTMLLVYTAIYMITPQDIVWHLTVSAERLALHIFPLAVFYTGMVINEDIAR